MKLAADAYGFPDSELPEEVSGYVLNVVEKQMSPGEKRLEAASILFGDNYRAEKEVITQYTDQFMERLSERMDKELGQVEDGVLQTTVRQWHCRRLRFCWRADTFFILPILYFPCTSISAVPEGKKREGAQAGRDLGGIPAGQ